MRGFATWVVLAAAFLLARDRGYFEEDQYCFFSGAMNLADAKAGRFDLYRRAQQPLAYEALSVVYRASGRRTAPFFWLSPICGAAGIALLAGAAWRAAGKRIGGRGATAAAIGAIFLCLPELVYTGLYFNTTALGLAPFALAVWLLAGEADVADAGSTKRALLEAAGAGTAFGVAYLLRFDFALAGPLLLLWSALRARSWRAGAAFAAGAAAPALLAMAAGVFVPRELMQVREAQSYSVRTGGWGAEGMAAVFFSLMPIFALVALGVGCSRGISRAWNCGRWAPAALALVAAPMLYPVFYLLSPKYLVPAVALAPLAFVWLLGEAANRFGEKFARRACFGFLAFALLFQFVSVRPTGSGEGPIVRWGADRVSTHDGRRSNGGYLFGYARVRGAENEANPYRSVRVAHRLAERLAGTGEDFCVVFGGGYYEGIGRWVLPFLLQSRGYRFEIVKPRTEYLFIGEGAKGGNRIRILPLEKANYAAMTESPGGPQERLLKIPVGRVEETTAQVDELFRALRTEKEKAEFAALPDRAGISRLEEEEGRVAIGGWVLSAKVIEKVEARRGDFELGTATYPLARPDVAKKFPEYGTDRIGFEFEARTDAEASQGEAGAEKGAGTGIVIRFVGAEGVLFEYDAAARAIRAPGAEEKNPQIRTPTTQSWDDQAARAGAGP